MLVANPELGLLSVIETLQRCHAVLKERASPDAARLLSMAILQLRLELNEVSESELKALCDLVLSSDEPAPAPAEHGLHPYLKLVK